MFGAGLCALAVTAWMVVWNPTPAPQPMNKASNAFIAACAGVSETNNDVIAYANCLGRISGVSDGHQFTAQLTGDMRSDIELWCTPPRTTDGALMATVLNWIESNPDRYSEIMVQLHAPTGAVAVIIAALHDAYPC